MSAGAITAHRNSIRKLLEQAPAADCDEGAAGAGAGNGPHNGPRKRRRLVGDDSERAKLVRATAEAEDFKAEAERLRAQLAAQRKYANKLKEKLEEVADSGDERTGGDASGPAAGVIAAAQGLHQKAAAAAAAAEDDVVCISDDDSSEDEDGDDYVQPSSDDTDGE